MSYKADTNKYLHEVQNKMDDSVSDTMWENDDVNVFL